MEDRACLAAMSGIEWSDECGEMYVGPTPAPPMKFKAQQTYFEDGPQEGHF